MSAPPDERLRELERRVTQLEYALHERSLSWTRKRLRSAKRLLISKLAPPVGVLRQHPPRAASVPDRYALQRAPDPAPQITLVTPSLDQGAYLEAGLRSVAAQAYPRLQHVVQDGGSTDGTTEVLRRWADRVEIEQAPDGGQAAAINRGFARARGEILGWLNADDELLPGSLAYVAAAFVRHPELEVVYGHRLVVDEAGREIGRWVLPSHDDRVLTFADYVPQETLFWRRTLWERVGGRLDESFHFAMDWELLLRFRKAGARFARLPRFLAAFRVHPAQKTAVQLGTKGAEEMARLREGEYGRALTEREIDDNVRPFLDRSALLHTAYRLGLVRY